VTQLLNTIAILIRENESNNSPSVGVTNEAQGYETPDEYAYEDVKSWGKYVRTRKNANWQTRIKRKRRASSKNRRKMMRFTPQSGSKMLDKIAGFGTTRELEAFCQMLRMLYISRTPEDILHAITCFARLYMNHAFCVVISDYFMELFADTFECDNRFKQQAGFEDFRRGMQSFTRNLKFIKNNEFSLKMHTFLSYAMSYAICNKYTTYEFTKEKFSLLNLSIKRNVSSLDFVECVGDTLDFICKRLQIYFNTGVAADIFRNEEADFSYYDDTCSMLLSKLPMLMSSNLHLIGMDEAEFADKLYAAIAQTKDYRDKNEEVPAMKHYFSYRLLELEKLRTRFMLARQRMGIKVVPFGLLLFGNSSIGKSVLSKRLAHQLLKVNGFPSKSHNIMSKNLNDAFDSEYDASKIAILLDDLMNTVPAMVKVNPVDALNSLFNNDQRPCLKAEVELKGIVYMRPKLVIGSTNIKSLDAHMYSNSPVSVVRRFSYTIDVNIHPAFRLDGGNGLDASKLSYSMVNGHRIANEDPWLMTVQTVKGVTNANKESPVYTVATHEGRRMENITLEELMRFLTIKSREHFEKQDALVADASRYDELEPCPHGVLGTRCSECQLDELREVDESQVIYESPLSDIDGSSGSESDSISCPSYDSYDDPETFAFQSGYLESEYVLWTLKCICAYPIFTFVGCIMCMNTILVCSGICSYWMTPLSSIFFRVCYRKFLNWINSMYGWQLVKKCGRSAESAYLTYLKPILLDKKILSLLVSVSSLFALYRMYKHFSKFSAHGNCVSRPAPDEEVRQNMWATCVRTSVPVSDKAKTMTYDQLRNLVSKKLVQARFEYDNGKPAFCNAFPIANSYWLLPSHTLVARGNVKVTLMRSLPDVIGNNFSSVITPSEYYHIPNTDFVLVNFLEGGPQKDMVDYFPLEAECTRKMGELLYRQLDMQITSDNIELGPKGIYPSQLRYESYLTNLPNETFNGLCMATAVIHNRGPCIAGFHLAGRGKQSLIACVTKSMIVDAINNLKARGQFTSSSGNITFAKYGVDEPMLSDAHRKDPINFLPMGSRAIFLGNHGDRRTFRTNVQPNIFAPYYESIMGKPIEYGPPKDMNHWRHWNKDLLSMTNTASDFKTHVLNRAFDDFKFKILSFLDSRPQLKSIIHPLDNNTILNGHDGVYGIDAIKFSTSAGAPLNKAKSNYLLTDESGEPLEPRQVQPMIWEEVARMEDCLLKGERCYAVHRANLKDEIIKLSKDKIRVFAGGEFAFLILVRKYFLSIFSLIMKNSFVFECAVGLNAHGTDWHKLVEHVSQFGKSRMIAGDYKSFDSNMSSTMTMKAMELLIQIAVWAGYSEEQITVMRGIATEICYPLYEYNGTYMIINGSNPSGHPGTVFVNNIANSLYLRYAYYDLSPVPFPPPFHHCVSPSNYGDDNWMSVAEECTWFNHTAIAKSLSTVGVTYTMADKTAESVPYLELEQVSFLKRTPRFDNDLNQWVAPIEENSILKSIQCKVKSDTLSNEEHGAEILINGMDEWFYHGRSKFEEMLSKYKLLSSACNLDMLTASMLVSYDDRLVAYREKHIE
jgi:hypothetical protein